MNKVVYIIPAFTESIKYKAYRKIGNMFSSRGIEPIFVDIHWKFRTMINYVDEFMDKYEKTHNGREVYLFGFSFGAMIAFISSININPKMQMLCSLSPYFREDLPGIKDSWKRSIGKRRVEAFSRYSFNNLAAKCNSETLLIMGSEEHELCTNRVNVASIRIKNSRLVVVPGAKHMINQPEYLRTLESVIARL